MTIKELASKHGVVSKEFHEGSVIFKANGYEMYIERTSFGYILQVYLNEGTTYRFDTIEELEEAVIQTKEGHHNGTKDN